MYNFDLQFSQNNYIYVWISENKLCAISVTNIQISQQPLYLATCDIAWTISTAYISKDSTYTDIFNKV